MNLPLVSVCITTFNQDAYIEDCIASVLGQAVDASLEILVGDDGAGPETPIIISRLMAHYPGVIRYFKHPKNLGPSTNYQFLIREARGDFIAHLDGDDLWLPGKLVAQLAWLKSHPDSVACYTNAIVVNDSLELQGLFSSPIAHPVDLAFLLSKGNFLNHSSLLYRATHKHVVLEFVGPFIDYRIHLNFARFGLLGFSNSALAVYRLGSIHSMIRTTPELVRQLYFDALVSVLSDPAIPVTLRRKTLRHFWRTIIVESIAKGQITWALGWAGKIKMAYPGGFTRIFVPGFFLALRTLSYLLLRRSLEHVFGRHHLKVLHER